jgi:hypothetical protein
LYFGSEAISINVLRMNLFLAPSQAPSFHKNAAEGGG